MAGLIQSGWCRAFTVNKAQRQSLLRKWRQNDQGMSYRAFRKAVFPYFDSSGCVMVQWSGMWLGIERDGYTHS